MLKDPRSFEQYTHRVCLQNKELVSLEPLPKTTITYLISYLFAPSKIPASRLQTFSETSAISNKIETHIMRNPGYISSVLTTDEPFRMGKFTN